MIRHRRKQQPLTDGVVHIYKVENAAPQGAMPIERHTLKHTLRYRERIVGMARYYAALQANVRVEKVIRTARLHDVSTQDTAMIFGRAGRPEELQHYRIVQVQYPDGVLPPAMDLTLQLVEERYGSAEQDPASTADSTG